MTHATSCEAVPSSRFFLVVAKGKVYIEMSRITTIFPTIESWEFEMPFSELGPGAFAIDVM